MSDRLDDSCGRCPLVPRRDFVRDATVAVAGIFAGLGLGARSARAMSWRQAAPSWSRDEEHAYPLPADDGAVIDKQIIIPVTDPSIKIL